jgi:hypothetical protein
MVLSASLKNRPGLEGESGKIRAMRIPQRMVKDPAKMYLWRGRPSARHFLASNGKPPNATCISTPKACRAPTLGQNL